MTDAAVHRLATPWVFSVEAHGDWGNTIDFAEVASVEAFWDIVENHFPKPSLAFKVQDDVRRATFLDKRIQNLRAFSVRRKGAALEWENQENEGMQAVSLPNATAATVDGLWETSLLLAVGGTFGPALAGVRLVDRGKKGGVDLRLEAWCTEGSAGAQGVADAWRPHLSGRPVVWTSFREKA